jgi:hypothetical protein
VTICCVVGGIVAVVVFVGSCGEIVRLSSSGNENDDFNGKITPQRREKQFVAADVDETAFS